MTNTQLTPVVLTPDAVLNYWLGHRRLTRKTIEAFPDDKLFSHSLGGMRPYGEMVMEFISMAEPIARGVATGKWCSVDELQASREKIQRDKQTLLARWDQDTIELNAIVPSIPLARFSEVEKAFGMWEGAGIQTIQYAIDNEIHHRGQAYVYLRSLGIEPPMFWDRG